MRVLRSGELSYLRKERETALKLIILGLILSFYLVGFIFIFLGISKLGKAKEQEFQWKNPSNRDKEYLKFAKSKRRLEHRKIGVLYCLLAYLLFIIYALLSLINVASPLPGYFSGIRMILVLAAAVIMLLGIFKVVSGMRIILKYENKNEDSEAYSYGQTSGGSQTLGEKGEELIQRELDHMTHSKYHVRHGIYVRVPNTNDVTEIDHLVIHENGIFLLETKGWEGYIDIDETGAVKGLRKKGEAWVGIKSPFAQIYNHERILRRILDNKNINIPIISCLAIGNEETIVEGKKYSPVPVLSAGTIHHYIENISKGKYYISKEQRDSLIKIIDEAIETNISFK